MKKWLGKIFDRTFLKFFIVGVINTIVGTVVMFVAYNLLHCSYWLSTALNYVVGSTSSYFLNKYYTFKKKEKSFKTVARFIINILVCYLVAYGIAKPLTALLLSRYSVKIQENGAMLVGLGFFVCLNYFGQRFFTFRKNEE